MVPLLVKLKNGEITRVEIIKFPDGQRSLKLDLKYYNVPKTPIDIKARICNWYDLELLLCLLSAFREADFIINDIELVYLFGMRCDRRFEPGLPHYFRDVLAPILNWISDTYSVGISIHQPHGRCLNYLKNGTDGAVAINELEEIFKWKNIIAADESANEMARYFGSYYTYTASLPEGYGHACFYKHRDHVTRKISASINSDFIDWLRKNDRPILIIDDLCDGGATFIEEAKLLRHHFPDRRIELFVYHGLFSRGLDVVCNEFDKVYTTNSFQDYPRAIREDVAKKNFNVIEVI